MTKSDKDDHENCEINRSGIPSKRQGTMFFQTKREKNDSEKRKKPLGAQKNAD